MLYGNRFQITALQSCRVPSPPDHSYKKEHKGKSIWCMPTLVLRRQFCYEGSLYMAPGARQVNRPWQHGHNPLGQKSKLLTHSSGSLVTAWWHLAHVRHYQPQHVTLLCGCSLCRGCIPDPSEPGLVCGFVTVTLHCCAVSRISCCPSTQEWPKFEKQL